MRDETMAYHGRTYLMVRAVSLIKSIGIENEKIDLQKYYCWRIQMEIVMTDKPTIQWCADKFGGKVYDKPRKEHKMQYTDGEEVLEKRVEIAKAILPYAVTKKEKLQQIIDHYGDKA
jgi:1-deoxy-D-xylulose 5-phosphate reductoisomerase